MKRLSICATVLIGSTLLACASCSRTPRADRVIVSGASTVYPIVQLAGEKLRASAGIEIQAEAGGSTRGFEDCINGRNDFGAMARDLTDDESRQVTAYPIAMDGVGFVVNDANPIVAITTEQLRRIYKKEITRWSALTPWEQSITTVNKAEGHATLEDFLHYVGLTREQVKADAVGGDNAQIIRLVANTPTAIGYVSIGEVLHAREIGIPVHLVRLDGVEPTLANVASKRYPISRTLYLVSKAKPGPRSQALLDFLQSAAGKDVVRKGMYVPLP